MSGDRPNPITVTGFDNSRVVSIKKVRDMLMSEMEGLDNEREMIDASMNRDASLEELEAAYAAHREVNGKQKALRKMYDWCEENAK